MAPILTLIISRILDYLADHADQIVEAIKSQFASASTNPVVKDAMFNLVSEPSHENLEKLHKCLSDAGEDASKLASVLVNETSVKV